MSEKRLGIVLEQGGENPGLRNMTPDDLREHPEWIKVGMGTTSSTALGGLHRALTVIDVRRGGKELDVQYDHVTTITPGNAWADDGEKEYTANLAAKIETITRRKDGSYIVKGQPMERWQTRFYIGFRRDWTDYSQ